MAGELSEKVEGHSHQSSRTSSHGDSTDEHESTRKQKTEPDAIQVSSDDPATLAKLDSNVKVEVKDEDLYAHLPEDEAQILRKQVDIPNVKSGWSTLYRYSTTWDIVIMVVAAICSIAAGAALPLMTVIFGNLAGEFNEYFEDLTSHAQFEHTITHMVLYFVYIGIAEFVTVYI